MTPLVRIVGSIAWCFAKLHAIMHRLRRRMRQWRQ